MTFRNERVLLISPDNNSFIHYFPLGLAYVATALKKAGHEVMVYPQDKYHYSENHLTAYLNRSTFTVVGIGMVAGAHQYRKLKSLCDAIHKASRVPNIILGGYMVSPDPNYFQQLTGAKKVFVGECEKELQEIEDWDKEEIIRGSPYDPDADYPAWGLFDINYYSLVRIPPCEYNDRCFPVLAGRGCPFRCSFCYRLEEGYRLRDIKHIIEEIEILQKDYRITFIDFADELLMTSEERSVEMAQALKSLGIKWKCNGRLNYAKSKVLKEMKEAGCVFINYGIESVDNDVLKRMNKALTFKQILTGVETTLAEGISPGLNMLWNNIGDTEDTLKRAVGFIKEYSDHSQMRTIRPVQPYPGTSLFQEAVRRGLVKDTADFYENKLINTELPSINFTDIPVEKCCDLLYDANKELILDYQDAICKDWIEKEDALYHKKDTTFRGFRPI